jgi:hypothetical protein
MHDLFRYHEGVVHLIPQIEVTLVLATAGQEWTVEWTHKKTEISFGPEITLQTENKAQMQTHHLYSPSHLSLV